MMASDVKSGLQSSGSLLCADVQALLSDWLDVRRGEIPPAGISPLAEENFRTSYDAHLCSCQHCKVHLQDLETLGTTFSDFSVDEVSTAHFKTYASKVRQRIEAEVPVSNVVRVPQEQWTNRRNETPRWAPWVVMVASSSAAAMVAVVITVGMLGKSNSSKVARAEYIPPVAAIKVVAETKKEVTPAKTPKTPRSLVNMKYESAPGFLLTANGTVQQVNKGPKVDPVELLKQLDSELSKQGALVFWESPVEIEKERKCLLGMALLSRSPNQQAAPENTPEGLKIVDLLDKSPAYMKARLLPGDVIISLNDMTFERSSPSEILKFYNAIETLGVGETVTMEYARKEGDFWVIRQTGVQLGDYTQP